jgi:hypothetical protein
VPESVSNIHSIWRKLGELMLRMLRRLEDRIRYLCRKALTARDDELGALLSELRSALHEHANREACPRPIVTTEEKAILGNQMIPSLTHGLVTRLIVCAQANGRRVQAFGQLVTLLRAKAK